MRTRRVVVAAVAVSAAVGAGAVAWDRTHRPGTTEVHSVTRGPDERTLLVRYMHGHPACGLGPAGVRVEETRREIRLTARVNPPNGGTCPAIGIFTTETVTLSEPLGTRVVVDAKAGNRIDVAPRP